MVFILKLYIFCIHFKHKKAPSVFTEEALSKLEARKILVNHGALAFAFLALEVVFVIDRVASPRAQF